MKPFRIAILTLLLMAGLQPTICSADLVYTLTNSPGDQDGATLIGSITTDGTVDDSDPLGARISEVNIVSWEYTVQKPGFADFSVDSTMSGAFIELPGTWANSTRILASDSNFFRFGVNSGGSETSISYRSSGSPSNYFANFESNTSPRGWNTNSPAGFDDGSGWVIAARAIPEPSSMLLLSGVMGWALRRRRRKIVVL